MFNFNKSLMFLHKKADLPTFEGVCPCWHCMSFKKNSSPPISGVRAGHVAPSLQA